jgi:hypothetical protein
MKLYSSTDITSSVIIRNLELNLMTLRAAKIYYMAFGVTVEGNTKDAFIKSLSHMVKGE